MAAPSRRKKKKKKKAKPDPFAEFRDFSETVQKLPPHRILAINRGERAGRIEVRFQADADRIREASRKALIPENHPFTEFLNTAVEQSLNELILPSIEREIRRDLTERSETHAVNVFARNLRHLFLQPPVSGHRILGVDPGYRSGCKAAAIDETGQPLGHGVFSIVGNEERINHNKQRLVDLVNKFEPELIAIGNGNGCRAVEQFVSQVINNELANRNLQYTIVNQAGTSAYSTGETAREELPDHDPVIRSAISIARRLQDPLSELVKVNPANIGVGMYQHDIKAQHLADALDAEVASCVNLVGVNANTAGVSLLKYVSGLGQTAAANLVESRKANGPFSSREDLKKVSGFGDVTFVQAAGFLRIGDSANQLDRTAIHPESYEIAEKILASLQCKIEELELPKQDYLRRTQAAPPATSDAGQSTATPEGPATTQEVATPTDPASETSLEKTEASPAESAPKPPATEPSPGEFAAKKKRRNELVHKIKALDAAKLAREMNVGEMKIRDILRSIRNPLQDPRDESPAPVFRKGILKLEDLKPGMQLRGQIVNVVDFGVFLNVGIGESCLVHISRLSNRYVRDPHWFFAVGDVLNVWVQEVDKEKRRVTLTAIRPESARRERRRPPRGEARGAGKAAGRGRGRGGGRSGKPQGKGKPHHKRTRKPKPVTPITQEMVEGKKPMRSFSDLLQFHKKKTDDEKDKDKES